MLSHYRGFLHHWPSDPEYGDKWWQWDAVAAPDESRIPDFPGQV